MPIPSFSIQFKPSDFFYNTADSAQNADLFASFPFQEKNIIAWANKVAHPEPPITSISNIFDPKICAIILNPAYDFKNTFLPSNMVFNNKFKKLRLRLQGSAGTDGYGGTAGTDGYGGTAGTDGYGGTAGTDGSSYSSGISNNISPESAAITGQIILQPSSPDQKPTTLEINAGKNSNIEWKQDESNNWQPTFDINAALSQEIPFTDVDGGQSNVIMTSDNPRCKFRKTCTMNHWHYSGACTTQIIKAPNGSTTCKCVCSGVPVFSNTTHSHCDPYTVNANGSGESPSGAQSSPAGLGLVAAIQGMKLKLNAKFPDSQFFDETENTPGEAGTSGMSGEDGTSGMSGEDGEDGEEGQAGQAGTGMSIPYKNSKTLIHNDKIIRQLIADYYFQVSENIRLQEDIKSRGIKDVTSQQALMDATVQYKTEYLKVFNIIVGIVGAGGYIYLMNQSQ